MPQLAKKLMRSNRSNSSVNSLIGWGTHSPNTFPQGTRGDWAGLQRLGWSSSPDSRGTGEGH